MYVMYSDNMYFGKNFNDKICCVTLRKDCIFVPWSPIFESFFFFFFRFRHLNKKMETKKKKSHQKDKKKVDQMKDTKKDESR